MGENEFILKIRTHLAEKHGEVYEQWEGLLSMLEDQYMIYEMAKNEIANNGILAQGPRGTWTTSPYIKVLNDASVQIQKLYTELGCSPKQAQKIKGKENNDESFLENLING